ncbi:MAG: transporter permease [Nocardioides sp.]|nr:transporter permease [Nocardioides sp.]
MSTVDEVRGRPVADVALPEPERDRSRRTLLGWRLAVVALLLVCWELVPRLMSAPSAFIVPLSASLRAGADQWSPIVGSLWPTLSAILVALVFAWLVGIVAGFVIGTSPRLRFLLLIFGALYAVPLVVVYPLISVWLGPGQVSKVLFASLYGVIPVLLTTASGVRSVDEGLRRSAQSMGASPRQLLTKVLIPAALPVVVSGLRLGGGLVLIAVIVCEMLASTSGGIGTLITAYRVQFNAGAVYFCILVVLAFALVMDQTLGAIERRVAGDAAKTTRTQPTPG